MRFPPRSGLRGLLSSERAATVFEYGVLIALVAVLVVLTVPAVGNRVSEKISQLAARF